MYSKLTSPEILDVEWALWVDRSEKGMSEEAYLQGLKLVYCFRSLKEFRNKWNEHGLSEHLDVNVNVRIFQKGVAPVWESNRSGGKWLLSFIGLGQDESLEKWEDLVLGLCSRRYCDDVINKKMLVGAVLSSRTWGTMMSLWSTGSDDSHVHKVRRKLRKCFDLPRIKFQSHANSVELNKDARSASKTEGPQEKKKTLENSRERILLEKKNRAKAFNDHDGIKGFDFRVLGLCIVLVVSITAIVNVSVV